MCARSSLTELMHLMSSAQGMVAGDTGLTHLAAALKVPTVALYGPTNHNLTGVLGAYCHISVSQLPCAPCLRRTCAVGPPGPNAWPPCMMAHLPESVWQSLQHVISLKSVEAEGAPML